MPVTIYTFIICILLSGSTYAFNNSAQIQNYHINQWDSNSDLGISKVTAIYQDETGYLWIGTPGGLLRFDGSRFKKFDKSNTPAIKSDYITTIYQDNDDTIWIGTKGGGLAVFRDGNWKSYTSENGLSDDFVHTIISDWQGMLWIGTDFGLNVLDQTRTKIAVKKNILFDRIITSLEIGIRGELFVGTFRSGLFRIIDDDITHIGYKEGLQNLSISKLKTDSKGRIWIGTLGGLYYHDIYDETVGYISGSTHVPVTDILETKTNEIWYSSMINGIICVTEPSLVIKKIPDEYVHTIWEDENGTIWAGTDAAGLIQIRESFIHSISLPDDIVISSSLIDETGKIWIGTRNSGLYVLEDHQVIDHFDQTYGISSNRITAISRDHNAGIWIGTRDAGISFIKKNKITRYLPDHHITDFLTDDTGLIYIGTSTGLYVKDSDSIKIILENISVNSISRNKNGDVVVATTEGIYQSTNTGFQKNEYKIFDRYPDVLSIFEDHENTLWLGTNGSGILMIKDDQALLISVNEGLPDNHIVNITADKTGNLWCGSYNGTFMLARNDLDKFAASSISYIVPVAFDEYDGMTSKQCLATLSFIQNDNLYITTSNGISVFDLNKIEISMEAIAVHIEEIRTGQENLNKNQNRILVPTGRNSMEVQITAFDYTAISKLHFRYKLEGYDRDFHYLKPDEDRTISYSDLPAGDFQLKLAAASRNSEWETSFSGMQITIPLPLYQNRFFIFTIYPALIALLLGIIYLRVQKRKKKIRDKYKTVHIAPEKREIIVQKLDVLFKEEKFYLDPDITLKKLAGKLHVHTNHLSRIINEKYAINFNDLVNKYRIGEAEILLSDPKNQEKTILELMYHCGFYSKSVFNTAFKKFTGQTPSEYRKKSMSY